MDAVVCGIRGCLQIVFEQVNVQKGIIVLLHVCIIQMVRVKTKEQTKLNAGYQDQLHGS